MVNRQSGSEDEGSASFLDLLTFGLANGSGEKMSPSSSSSSTKRPPAWTVQTDGVGRFPIIKEGWRIRVSERRLLQAHKRA